MKEYFNTCYPDIIDKFTEKASSVYKIINKNKKYLYYIIATCPEKDGIYQLSENIVFNLKNWSIIAPGKGGERYWDVAVDLLNVIGDLACHVKHQEVRDLWEKLEKYITCA